MRALFVLFLLLALVGLSPPVLAQGSPPPDDPVDPPTTDGPAKPAGDSTPAAAKPAGDSTPAAANPAGEPGASKPAQGAGVQATPAAPQGTPPDAAADDAELRELERALSADRAEAPDGAEGDAEDEPGAAAGLAAGLVRTFQSLNPDISFIADIALAYYNHSEPLLSGGHDPSGTGFTLQQLELAVGATVDPYFRFDANIVFSQFGVEIEEVYATTLSLPWNLQLRAGQFLTRFGRINNSHPHSWSFVDQVLVIGKFFGGEGNRGVGAELSVLLPLPWYVELVGSASDASGASTARSFIGGDDLEVESPLDFQYTAVVKQFFPLSDDWSLAWGLSYAGGPNASGRDNRSEIYGTDLYIKYRPITHGSYTIVSLELEWMLRRRQIPDDVLMDHGMYAQLFWRFSRRWAVAARYELVGGVDNDPLDPAWDSARHRGAGNITFWPTEFSRLRLQYTYDHPNWRGGYHGVILALEFAAGAHGAHKF